MGAVLPKSKYNKLIRSLADEELYTASTIADLAVDFYKVRRNGKERTSIRKAVYGRTKRYQFPIEGDDQLKAIGHAAIPAWYGRRWKQSLDEKALNKILKKEPGSGKKWLWKTLILGFPILVLAGISVVGPSRLREGYDLLKTQGPTAAYLFFLDHESEETLVGKGWAAFYSNHFIEARKIAVKLMSSEGDFKGQGLYLLAYIELFSGNLDKSYNFFLETLDYYQSGNNSHQLFLIYLGMARVAVESFQEEPGGLELAEKYINEALKFDKPNDTVFFLRSRIEFERGDYQAAINYSKAQLEKFSDNLQSRGSAYANIAFNLVLLGEYDEGIAFIKKTETVAFEAQDESLLYHNMITDYIFSKCNGFNSQETLETIKQYYKRSQDFSILRFIDFAEKYSCKSIN